ncbi:hypothetical protein, partial [Streptomyces amritsarensis]|uniref:hypothetical protein n=1 Tax=Streptomyces amritsarensis TaxID=681158 RepID=UPI00117E5B43
MADIDQTPRIGTYPSVCHPASHIPTKTRAAICDAPALANGLQLGTILERLKAVKESGVHSMHVPDGFINAPVSVAAGVAAAAAVAVSLRG